MPFKSKAQRRKFAELLMKGEISDEVYEEWNRETGDAKLPEYAHGKPGAKAKKSKAKRKSKPKIKAKRVTKSRARSKTRSKSTRKRS